jgi:hypothetical protein
MFFSWIAIAKIDLDAHIQLPSNDYLKVSPNPGFLNPLGITSSRAYRPWLISLQIDVWQEIQRRINKEVGGIATGRSQVLQITEPNSSFSQTVTFTTRFYRPNIIAIEVQLKTEMQASLQDAFVFRELESHPSIYAAVDSIIGIVKSGSARGYERNNSFFSRPAILIPLTVTSDQFSSWKENNKNLIANLLINNKLYDAADPTLAEKIFERNKDIDIKYSNVGFSLVSKQGIVTVYSENSTELAKHLAAEHNKRFRFLEYALALREFISEYPDYRQHNENLADFLLFLAMPFCLEKASLPKTVTGTLVWQILSEELRFSVEVEKLDTHFLKKLEEKSEIFSKIEHKEFHSFQFHEKVAQAFREARKNWLQRFYESHSALTWLFGTTIALSGVGLAVAKLYLDRTK